VKLPWCAVPLVTCVLREEWSEFPRPHHCPIRPLADWPPHSAAARSLAAPQSRTAIARGAAYAAEVCVADAAAQRVVEVATCETRAM